ncbi:MAG: hypothetical protein P4L99_13100 [Chthoniobacter sp.]|nr:hypothetical protein [Chthoniobacter sp.]
MTTTTPTLQAVEPSAESRPRQPPCATVRAARRIRISPEGNQCWYRAVSQQLEITIEQLAAILRHTVGEIDDVPTLVRYGLMDSPEDDSLAAMERAKQKYLGPGSDFRARRNGGSVEMYLLSHAMDGALSFLVVDVESRTFTEPLRRYCAVDLEAESRSGMVVHARKEICLHYCSYTGARGASPFHYDRLEYELTDGRRTGEWTELHLDTTAHRRQREQLLLRVAKDAVMSNRAVAKEELLQTEFALEMLLEEERGQPAVVCPTRRSVTDAVMRTPTKRSRGTPKRTRSGTSSATIAGVTPTAGIIHSSVNRASHRERRRAAPPAIDPGRARPHVCRVVPKPCQGAFLATFSPYFENYSRLHQEGEVHARAALFHQMLDLPGQSLRRGPIRQIMQSLEQQQSAYTELVQQPDALFKRPVGTHPPPPPPPFSSASTRLETDSPCGVAPQAEGSNRWQTQPLTPTQSLSQDTEEVEEKKSDTEEACRNEEDKRRVGPDENEETQEECDEQDHTVKVEQSESHHWS